MFGLFNSTNKSKRNMQILNVAAFTVAACSFFSDPEKPLSEHALRMATHALTLVSLSQDESVLWPFVGAAVNMMRVGDIYARVTSGSSHAPLALSLLGAALHLFNAPVLLIIDDKPSAPSASR